MDLSKYDIDFVNRKIDKYKEFVDKFIIECLKIDNLSLGRIKLRIIIIDILNSENLKDKQYNVMMDKDDLFKFVNIFLLICEDDLDGALLIMAKFSFYKSGFELSFELKGEYKEKYKSFVIDNLITDKYHYNSIDYHTAHDILKEHRRIDMVDSYLYMYRVIALIEHGYFDLGKYKEEILEDLNNGIFNEKIKYFLSILNDSNYEDLYEQPLKNADILLGNLACHREEQDNWKEDIQLQLIKSAINLCPTNVLFNLSKYIKTVTILEYFNIFNINIDIPKRATLSVIRNVNDNEFKSLMENLKTLLNDEVLYSRLKKIYSENDMFLNGKELSNLIISNEYLFELLKEKDLYASHDVDSYTVFTCFDSGALNGEQLKIILETVFEDLGMNPETLNKSIKIKEYKNNIS